MSSLAFGQGFGQEDAPLPELLGRVTIEEIDVYTQPRSDTSLIVGKRYRDQLIALYYSLTAPDGPAYNPIWYRLWGGYTYSGYILPGVPWTSFFVYETGVAFHGTFWHNNFGVPMSRGCVNMRNADAKWLFRWTTPIWEVPVRDRSSWDRRGHGTRVLVY